MLPQNLIGDWSVNFQEDPPIGIVDWEFARVGDPAYDLAIVSRGNRKVLGVADGLKALVEDYRAFGGQPISIRDVRIHELILILYWLDEARREYRKPRPRGHGPEYYEDMLRSRFVKYTS